MAKEGLRKWFSRNQGKGWVDCKTGKPCGRRKGEKRKGYPACRPTMAQCTSAMKKKTSSKRIRWKYWLMYLDYLMYHLQTQVEEDQQILKLEE